MLKRRVDSGPPKKGERKEWGGYMLPNGQRSFVIYGAEAPKVETIGIWEFCSGIYILWNEKLKQKEV